MRGSPLLRALAALLLLSALAWPLHRMLQAGEKSEAPPLSPAAGGALPGVSAPLQLQVSFTTPPAAFAMKSLGMEVWRVNAPGAEIRKNVALAFPKEGVDLEFHVSWPNDTSAAARVQLTTPDGTVLERFVWGTGETSSVLTFQ